MLLRFSYLFLFFAILPFALLAQGQPQPENNAIHFSGLVVTGDIKGNMIPVPYTTVRIKGKRRATYADGKGFFSIVAEKGDKVTFSAVGFETIHSKVPNNLTDPRYSVVQIMTQDTINLPEMVIFPWPSRENFKEDFLAINVHNELRERAMKNLTPETITRLADILPKDGNENGDFYLREQAKALYYKGQTPPMNIFNPLAWQQFFQAWKEGKYNIKPKSRDD
jgi:CarboxypepD_reg-like domain